MAGKPKYTAAQVSDALKECNGLLFLAAEKLGCCSKTLQRYMARHVHLARLVDEKRGRRVDAAEAKLDIAVEAGEAWAIQFLLRTQGKDRGYVERTDHEHEHRGEVVLRVKRVVVDAASRSHSNGRAASGAGGLLRE